MMKVTPGPASSSCRHARVNTGARFRLTLSPRLAAMLALLGSLLSCPAEFGAAQASRPPMAADAPRWGVVYASPTTAGFGLQVGQEDRALARRAAANECRRSGGKCLLLAEFAERCAAVVQGLARFPARHASRRESYSVVAIAAGVGRTETEAADAAMEACSTDGRQRSCMIVASACAGPKMAL